MRRVVGRVGAGADLVRIRAGEDATGILMGAGTTWFGKDSVGSEAAVVGFNISSLNH